MPRKRIGTLWEGEAIHGGRRTWLQHLRTVSIFPKEDLGQQIQEIEEWVKGKRLIANGLLDATGWEWSSGDQEFKWKCAGKVETRREGLRNQGVFPRSCSSLMEWVDFSLLKLRKEVEYTVVLSNYIDRIWKELNHKGWKNTWISRNNARYRTEEDGMDRDYRDTGTSDGPLRSRQSYSNEGSSECTPTSSQQQQDSESADSSSQSEFTIQSAVPPSRLSES
ncbi:hypothetical protein R1sor_000329 [Riccia sorocarpa]|uniref:Uncharacterized protein n=1 Tax=Riccia sorocarpa TaxID=122646 RepID=A0ABD3GSS8_9MARC